MNTDLSQVIRSVFDELDMQQLKVFARHSPTRRLQIMFDLCEFSRQMVIATERQNNPEIDEAVLIQRVRTRIQLANGI